MSEFPAGRTKLFVGGEWMEPRSDAKITVISPVTEQPIAHVPAASRTDVDEAVAAARQAFDLGPWPRMSPAQRIEVVLRLKTAMERRKEELEVLRAKSGGLTDFPDSRFVVHERMQQWKGRTPAPGRTHRTTGSFPWTDPSRRP